MANSAHEESWNGELAAHWIEYEDLYNVATSAQTERLMTAAAVAPADEVLDIGCGTGKTTRMAAGRATRGAALGVDLSVPMLAQARLRAEEEGVPNARFQQADAQQHDFPAGAYDVALSRYGVMFFDDPVAAFANVRRALRPGGRLAFLCWQGPGAAFGQVPREVLARHGMHPDPYAADAPGPYALADPARVHAVLDGAGLHEVRVEPVEDPLNLGPDAAAALEFTLGRPWVRTLLAEAAPETRTKAVDELRTALTPYETPSGVLMQCPAWLVTAHRGDSTSPSGV